jgi:3-deoxy-7-phosphoheptulonate synthase
VLKAVSHLPVIVDPSHGTGVRCLVPIMARAAAVIGTDGLLVEVHPTPEKAWSDAAQTLSLEEFDEMMRDLRRYVQFAPAFDVVGPHLLAAGGTN